MEPSGRQRYERRADTERPDDDSAARQVCRLLNPVPSSLSVVVPDALQRTICLWVAEDEGKYTESVARAYRFQDQALLDFFSLIRMERAVFLQTWAARVVATSLLPDVEILRHPLLNNDHFRNFCETMSKISGDGGVAA